MEQAHETQQAVADWEARARAAEERAQVLETRLHIERSARRAGVVDEEAAYQLLDLARIERDAEGKPTNVEDLLADLLRRRPWLRDAPHESLAASTPANPSREAVRRLSRDAIRRMTPEEINAHWEAVEAALRET